MRERNREGGSVISSRIGITGCIATVEGVGMGGWHGLRASDTV